MDKIVSHWDKLPEFVCIKIYNMVHREQMEELNKELLDTTYHFNFDYINQLYEWWNIVGLKSIDKTNLHYL